MYYVGLDWSEGHHNLCILNDAGAVLSELEFKHTLEGFEKLELERRKLGAAPSAYLVAIKTAYNVLVDFLLDRDYAIYLIPPQATKGYRNRRHISGAHTDDTDAALLASIMRTDRNSHCRLRPHAPLTQQILTQVRLIEILRRTILRQTNQLRTILFRIYPQAVGLFGKLTTQINLHFLSAYPTAQEALSLSRIAFEDFCLAHGYRRADLISRRYAQLMAPAPAANPAAVQAYRD